VICQEYIWRGHAAGDLGFVPKADQATLGFVDDEINVLARAIRFRRQLILKLNEIVFQAKLELRGWTMTALATRRFAVRHIEIGPVVNVGIVAAYLIDHRVFPRFSWGAAQRTQRSTTPPLECREAEQSQLPECQMPGDKTRNPKW